MRVFDAHVHNFWFDRSSQAGPESFLDALNETAAAIGTLKIALLGNPGAEGHDALSAALERYPELLCGMGWLRLDEDPPSLIDEFADRGFHGIKTLGPSKNYDDEAYYAHYERAQERGLRILFHTGILGGPVDYLMGSAEDAWKAPPTGEEEAELVAKLRRERRP